MKGKDRCSAAKLNMMKTNGQSDIKLAIMEMIGSCGDMPGQLGKGRR